MSSGEPRSAGRGGQPPVPPEEKKRLLAYLLEQAGFGAPKPITPRPERDRSPLSFAQQRLWFLQQLEPESPAYNLPCVFRLAGALDVGVLERTLGEIVRRHEVLRTTFQMEGGQLIQVIHEPEPVKIGVVELRGVPESERQARVAELALEHARRRFDLARGPLYRVTLLRLGDEEYVTLFAMHHIVSDGWSTGILMHEVATLYDAFSQGRSSPLPELPVQYADFAHWQRGCLRGRVLDEQLGYWREQLAGAPPALELPTDRPRTPARGHNGAVQIIKLPPDLADEIRAFSKREGATVFMTLLAAFNLLLYRYAKQEDILVGTPLAGRTRAEVEHLIGFFVNTLVIRTDLSGDPTFRELLRRVRERCLGAYTHQDVPFERLVEELQPERDLSRTPIFQVTFTFQQQQAGAGGFDLGGLSLNPLNGERGTTQYDLSVNILDMGQAGMAGPLEYDTDLFEFITIVLMILCYQDILRTAVARPDLRLSEVMAEVSELEKRQHRNREQWYEEYCRGKLGGTRRRGVRANGATHR